MLLRDIFKGPYSLKNNNKLRKRYFRHGLLKVLCDTCYRRLLILNYSIAGLFFLIAVNISMYFSYLYMWNCTTASAWCWQNVWNYGPKRETSCNKRPSYVGCHFCDQSCDFCSILLKKILWVCSFVFYLCKWMMCLNFCYAHCSI